MAEETQTQTPNVRGYASISMSDLNKIIKEARESRKAEGKRLKPYDRVSMDILVKIDRDDLVVYEQYQCDLLNVVIA